MRGGWPLSLVIEGKPPVKKRPRFGKGRVYKADDAAELATGLALRRQVPEPLRGNLCLVAVFYMPDRRVLDGDNLSKHLWDAANGVLWRDDSQVTRSAQFVELDRERPRTELLLGSHDGVTLVRA